MHRARLAVAVVKYPHERARLELPRQLIIEEARDPGVGEPGVPPLAPALGNAWRALTGNKQYQLPFGGAVA